MSLWTPSGEHPVRPDRSDRPAPATSTPGTSTPATSTPATSTPATSTPATSTPATSTPATSTPATSTPGRSGRGPAPGGRGGAGGAARPEGDLDALRRQLAEAPAEVVVANHCYGLFELAAVYLSDSSPRLEHARLAIDALGYLVDGLGERLGEAHAPLRDALGQIRLAFVQIAAANEQAGRSSAS